MSPDPLIPDAVMSAAARRAIHDASVAAALLAVAPAALGGVILRGTSASVRHVWLANLRTLLPQEHPLVRCPASISPARLTGGLDLAATLSAGKPMHDHGLLASCQGGIVAVAMAERLPVGSAALIAAAMDAANSDAAKSGAAFGVVLFDESEGDEDRPAAILRERLAIEIDLSALHDADLLDGPLPDIAAARARLPGIHLTSDAHHALAAAAVALGVGSLRASCLAARVARISAALAGLSEVSPDDLAAAGRLVLAPRATRLPVQTAEADTTDPATDPAPQERSPDHPAEPDPPSQPAATTDAPPAPTPPPTEDQPANAPQVARQPLADQVIDAARAALPAGLLAQLALASSARAAGRDDSRAGGRKGEVRKAALRGRVIGTRRGDLRRRERLNLIETLRAAAPWQPLRRRLRGDTGRTGPFIEVRSDDVRLSRFRQHAPTLIIFVVDASGSAALERLAEAKGAVELLLADCYARRDQVAVIAFRGARAELILPATRSLHRARRQLAGLPGGGGTPLASAIDMATRLADDARRKGQTPTLVFLTDGRANVSQAGIGGRAQAEADARMAAHALRRGRLRAVLVDSSVRPEPRAARIAEDMGAIYVPLPRADAAGLSQAVKAAA